MEPAVDDARDWMAERLCALMQPDTTSGAEDRGLGPLLDLLRELGAEVVTQPVADGSSNVLATWGEPELLLTTHLDTVPPYLPPRQEAGIVWGRGACDAKGQIVTQLAVIKALLGRRSGLAWLGVVREETDGAGASKALELADRLRGLRGILNGEPTGNHLGAGQRGFLRLRLTCSGVAAHSGTPDLGRSATWPLIDWLQRLRAQPRPVDADLGPEVWNLGIVHAGDAVNVIPQHAEAEILARTVPGSDFLERVRQLAPAEGSVAVVADDPPDRFPRIPGQPMVPLTFGSDLPKLRRLAQGRPVALVGPGSIAVAHTDQEHVRLEDLCEGVARLRGLALWMLGAGAGPQAGDGR